MAHYTGRLLRALGLSPLVIATHWDEQSLPYGAPQDERLRETDVFGSEVKAVSPKPRVIVPRHFETIVLGSPGRAPSSAKPGRAQPRRAFGPARRSTP